MQHAVFFADIDDGHAIARDRESLNGDGDNRTGIERRTAVSRATRARLELTPFVNVPSTHSRP